MASAKASLSLRSVVEYTSFLEGGEQITNAYCLTALVVATEAYVQFTLLTSMVFKSRGLKFGNSVATKLCLKEPYFPASRKNPYPKLQSMTKDVTSHTKEKFSSLAHCLFPPLPDYTVPSLWRLTL